MNLDMEFAVQARKDGFCGIHAAQGKLTPANVGNIWIDGLKYPVCRECAEKIRRETVRMKAEKGRSNR